MKVIKPKVEFIKEKNPLKRIEQIARVCWGTESKINEKSARKFCEKLLKMGHTSPFEHARIIIPMTMFLSFATAPGTPYGYYNRYAQILYNGRACVAMNCRDFLAIGGNLDAIEELDLATDFATARFTIDIGISRELVRHRQMSFMERSTRYINMKDGIDFILPAPFEWAGDIDESLANKELPDAWADPRYQTWYFQCETSEFHYQKLLKEGCQPQEARNLLPLSTATVIYVTGMFNQWHDLLELRADKAAHPQMQHIMKLLLENEDCPEPIKQWQMLRDIKNEMSEV